MNDACTAFMKLLLLLNVTRPDPKDEKTKMALTMGLNEHQTNVMFKSFLNFLYSFKH